MPDRQQLRHQIKRLLAAVMYYSGILYLVLHWRARHGGVVLLYHRVLPDAECAASFSSKAIMVSPATFDMHLRFLQRHFTLVDPPAFREWLLNRRSLDRPPCLITFDDGWQDNFTHAVPLLKARNVPALIFLPTDYIGSGRQFWQERLSHLLFRIGQRPELQPHPAVMRHGLSALFTVRQADLVDCACNLARSFKKLKPADVDALVTEIETLLTPADPDRTSGVDTFLSWEDVQTMQAQGIHFGSHTVSHRILTQLDRTAVSAELAESRQTLEDRLGAPVLDFAYPNGNYDRKTCQAARAAGYALAFTTVPGWVAPENDPMQIPRLNVHDGAHRHLPLFFAAVLNVL